MSNPAFQLRGDQFEDDGAYGTSLYDSAPYGGQDWPPYELPKYHLGSDDLQQIHRSKISEIVQFRHNVPISVRSFGKSIDSWRVNFAVILAPQLPLIKVFFEIRVFDLLPNGITTESRRVRWIEEEFHPAYISPGVYSLGFTIQEFPE